MPPVFRNPSPFEFYINVGGIYTPIDLVFSTVIEKTAAYTLTLSDSICVVDATGGAVTITLPTAASAINRCFYIKKIDASGNAVTVDGDGSETIDGATTASLASQYDSVQVVSDGTEWWII